MQTSNLKNINSQEIGFKRESFVKDLYNPQHFLNNFNYVVFSSPLDFVNAMQKDFYVPRNILVIQINSLDNLNLMKQIIGKSKIGEICELFLHIKDWKLYSHFEGMENNRVSVIMDYVPEMDEMMENLIIDGERTAFCLWRNKNRLFFRFNITFENIDSIFEKMIDTYQRELTRFFDITIDYASFDDAKIRDIPRIKYRCTTFINWHSESRKNKDQNLSQKTSIQVRNYRYLIKKVFIKSEKIFLSEQHFNENPEEPTFNLVQEKNGEDIPFEYINAIRQLIDLTDLTIIPKYNPKINGYHIDFYQNKKIGGVINELPIISEIFGWWML